MALVHEEEMRSISNEIGEKTKTGQFRWLEEIWRTEKMKKERNGPRGFRKLTELERNDE